MTIRQKLNERFEAFAASPYSMTVLGALAAGITVWSAGTDDLFQKSIMEDANRKFCVSQNTDAVETCISQRTDTQYQEWRKDQSAVAGKVAGLVFFLGLACTALGLDQRDRAQENRNQIARLGKPAP